MMGTGPRVGPGPGSKQHLWFYVPNLGIGAWGGEVCLSYEAFSLQLCRKRRSLQRASRLYV